MVEYVMLHFPVIHVPAYQIKRVTYKKIYFFIWRIGAVIGIVHNAHSYAGKP